MENIEILILEMLKRDHEVEPGYWFGYCDIQDELYESDIVISVKEIKVHMKSLHKQGKVRTEPIFSESTGLLCGKGYFYNVKEPI